MKNTLILLSSGFPYMKTEGFLNNEIDIINNGYDRVIIIPVLNEIVDKLDLPSNIIVKPVIIKPSRIKYMIKGCSYLLSNHETWKLVKTLYKSTLKRKSYYSYIRALSENTYDNVLKEIKKLEFSSDENIVIYSYWLNDLAYTAIKLKKKYFLKNNVITVSRTHGGDLYEERCKFGFAPLKKFCVKYSDAVYSCSKNGAVYLQKLLPEYASKIKYSYLGTKDWGAKNGENEKFTLVSCSYVYSIKRIDLIVDALVELAKLGKTIKWIHFGDGVLFNEIKQYAQSVLPKEIEYELYAAIENEELIKYYAKNHIDMFINVSSSEGIPVTMMEAISFGVPIFATNVGGVAEIVNASLGHLFDANVVACEIAVELAKYIDLSQADKNIYRVNARSMWNEKFNSDKNYNDFHNDIKKLLD